MVAALIEPGMSEQCTKVRLRTEEEALEFAARVVADTGQSGELRVYRCTRCPRQPVSLDRFFHITHADPAKQGQRGKADGVRPKKLLQHVTPADIARMHGVAR